MAPGGQFAAAFPELASTALDLLTVPGTGFGYLATVAAEGAPRIHPIMPVWAAESVFTFIGPSPKLCDLERDGRYALNSTGSEDVDDELVITGRAVIRGGRRQARAPVVSALRQPELSLCGVLGAPGVTETPHSRARSLRRA